nr:copia protein [Tanacetum cinerariifolium]
KDTLLQHMGNVKKSVFERASHQRQYNRRVNKRLMQTQESKIDMGKAVNDDLVVTESSGTESELQDDNSRWLPTGKLFDSCTSKVEREPTHGSNIDISKIHECKQTLDLSAGTSINVSKEQHLYASAGILWNVNKDNLRTMALNHDSLSTAIQRQEKVTQANRTVTTSNELDLLFSPMFDELLNGSSKVVSKSSAVSAADAPNQRQQYTTPLTNHTTPAPTCQIPTLEPTVISSENINQAETHAENDQVLDDDKVGALMYLTASRPEIMHVTCYCARYRAQPTEKHLTAVKRIFRYLKDTIHMGLWYPKDTGFELNTFSDSDHAGCLDSRKSTYGGIQFIGGDKLVSWSSKKQDCTSMSSAEAEYVSLSACCAQVLWMRTQLTDYGFYFDKIPIYCNSKAAIAISCNPVQHSRTKHIDVHHHFIKEKVEKSIVELFFVGTEYQLADLFTKSLPVERSQYLVRRLGMRCLTLAELEALANEPA